MVKAIYIIYKIIIYNISGFEVSPEFGIFQEQEKNIYIIKINDKST